MSLVHFVVVVVVVAWRAAGRIEGVGRHSSYNVALERLSAYRAQQRRQGEQRQQRHRGLRDAERVSQMYIARFQRAVYTCRWVGRGRDSVFVAMEWDSTPCWARGCFGSMQRCV